MSSQILLNKISKSYPNSCTPILKNISLNIEKGEQVAITGPSGSGKSSLMHIIGLLDFATSGTYYLCSKNVSAQNSKRLSQWRNTKLGFVFQSFHLLPRLTSLENIMLPLTYNHLEKQQAQQKAFQLLEKMNMLNYARKTPSQMSGGQQQRIAIARALICQPEIILADEPTGSLDSKNSQEIIDLLFTINKQQNTTLIIVTHDSNISRQFSRCVNLEYGMLGST